MRYCHRNIYFFLYRLESPSGAFRLSSSTTNIQCEIARSGSGSTPVWYLY